MYHQTAVWVVFLLAFSVIRETSTFSAGIGNLGLAGKRELPSFKVREEQILYRLIGTFKVEMKIVRFRDASASQKNPF